MIGSTKWASFLVLFALCSIWANKEVFGHFSIGRDVKRPFREGQINSQRNFERESHLRQNQRRTGNWCATKAIDAILRNNLSRKFFVYLLYFSLIAGILGTLQRRIRWGAFVFWHSAKTIRREQTTLIWRSEPKKNEYGIHRTQVQKRWPYQTSAKYRRISGL